jgi:hypothetical protein
MVAKTSPAANPSSFQILSFLRQHRFIGPKTATSNGCIKWVEFSGRKINLK